jgi:hypothetical protein
MKNGTNKGNTTMRKIRVTITTDQCEVLDRQEITVDDDVNQIVLSAARDDSSILRGQVGTMYIGSETTASAAEGDKHEQEMIDHANEA